MTWFSQSANETEAAKEHVNLCLAVAITLASGTSRYWTGVGSITLLGNTYIGVGQMGAISVAPETTQMRAERKTYQLSGVDPTLIAQSDIDSSFGRGVTEYFFFLTADGVLVAPPEINWEGRIDSIRRVDGLSPVIEISAEHRMILLDKSDNWRYTHEHQQQFFSGDDGFDQVPMVASATIIWGGYPIATGGGGGGGAGPGGRKTYVP